MTVLSYVPGRSIGNFQNTINDINKDFVQFAPTITAADVAKNALNKGLAFIRRARLVPQAQQQDSMNRFVPYTDSILTISPFKFRQDDIIVETEEFNFLIGDFDISRQSYIVKNKLNMSGDSVKTVTGQSDYNISFSGILLATDIHNKPDDYLDSFLTIMNSNQPLPVIADTFGIADIDYIVIEDFSFKTNWQSKNTYPFTFKACSHNIDTRIIATSNPTFSFKNDAEQDDI